MKIKIIFLLLVCILMHNQLNAQKIIELNESFSRVIVSPHIETVFVKGDKASIEIKEITIPEEKLKYEFYNGNTLQVYLEGAKTYTKNKKQNNNVYKTPLYNGRVAQVIITYTDVTVFSVRGEELVVFESPIEQNECILRFYGDSQVTVKNIKVDELIVEIYGSSFLTIENGFVKNQKIRAYGSSTIMATAIDAKETKISAYGDGNYQLNASDEMKINSYGSSKILYKGGATLKKGMVIGESTIDKL